MIAILFREMSKHLQYNSLQLYNFVYALYIRSTECKYVNVLQYTNYDGTDAGKPFILYIY